MAEINGLADEVLTGVNDEEEFAEKFEVVIDEEEIDDLDFSMF